MSGPVSKMAPAVCSALNVACVGLLLSGCIGDLVPLVEVRADAGAADGTGASTDDASGPADDASVGDGSTAADASSDDAGALHFATSIQPFIDSKGCGNCHAGMMPVIAATSTPSSAQIHSNYESILGVIDETAPAQSLVLQKLLETPPTTHGGGMLLTGTSDPSYVMWLSWISAGAPE